MTNKPKAPQNNTGKHPTYIAATQAPALSQTHNNSCSRARYCHIFSKDAKPKTHTPLTHDLELTRDAGCRLRAPDSRSQGRGTCGGLDVWCVSQSSSHTVETQRPRGGGCYWGPLIPHWRPRGRLALQSPSEMRDRPSVHRDGPLICSVVPLKPCILQKRGERETSSKHDKAGWRRNQMKMCSCSGFTLSQRGQWNQCGNDEVVSKSGISFFRLVVFFLKLKQYKSAKEK